jgi:hypothetical protein
MNLIKCEACGHDVSPAAAACPNCGHPVSKVSVARPNKGKSLGAGCGGLFVIGIVGFFAYVIYAGSAIHEREKVNPTCVSNFQKCQDNTDLVEHHSRDGISLAVLCKSAAQDTAKYGSPTFPFVPFGTYYSGRSYLDSGTATLIEKSATFKNGFGADERVSVICRYDLKADKAAIEIVRN